MNTYQITKLLCKHSLKYTSAGMMIGANDF